MCIHCLMKKRIYFFAIALFLVATSAIVILVRKNKHELIYQNLHALLDTEYTVYGHCREHDYACVFFCPNCNAELGSVPASHLGPAYNVHGTCPKCKEDF